MNASALESQRERQRQRERSGLYASTAGGRPGAEGGGDEAPSSSRPSHGASAASDARAGERSRSDSERVSSRERERDRDRDSWRGERDGGGRDKDRDRDRDRGYERGGSSGREHESERERGRERAERPGGGTGQRRRDWEVATPVRRADGDDEWAVTPAVPSGQARGAGGRGRAGSSRQTGRQVAPRMCAAGVQRAGAAPHLADCAPRPPPRAGPPSSRPGGPRSFAASGGAGWGGGDTPLPHAAIPSGAAAASGGGGGKAFGRVAFDVAPSPALTPSFASNSWMRKPAARSAPGGPVTRSPDLRPEGGRGWWGRGRVGSRQAGVLQLARGPGQFGAVALRLRSWACARAGEERRGEGEGEAFDEMYAREREDEERQAERDWYDNEEFGGGTEDHGTQRFVGDENLFAVRPASVGGSGGTGEGGRGQAAGCLWLERSRLPV